MPSLDLHLDADGCWPELRDSDRVIDLMGDNAPPVGLALLRNATVGGRPTVTIRIDLPDGRVVLTETTFALFQQAVRAMEVRIENF